MEKHAAQVDMPATQLSACLSQFEYRWIVVVNHIDDSMLPADRRDWLNPNLVMISLLAAVGGRFVDVGPTRLVLLPTYERTSKDVTQWVWALCRELRGSLCGQP
jgi:hypothetical protein